MRRAHWLVPKDQTGMILTIHVIYYTANARMGSVGFEVKVFQVEGAPRRPTLLK